MTDQISSDRLKNLKKTREIYRTKAFGMMIEIAFIFGLPAFAALLIGKKLDVLYGTGRTIVISMLAGTFIISWIVVIFRYRQLDRAMKKIDAAVKAEKKNRAVGR